MEKGYTVKLGNPAGFGRYSGLKHEDDKTDAFFLTEMESLNILPQGYIYPSKLHMQLMLIHLHFSQDEACSYRHLE